MSMYCTKRYSKGVFISDGLMRTRARTFPTHTVSWPAEEAFMVTNEYLGFLEAPKVLEAKIRCFVFSEGGL